VKHRLLLLVNVLALAVAGRAGGATRPRLWGVFTERGFSNIPMKPGLNARVFNDFTLDAHDYGMSDNLAIIEQPVWVSLGAGELKAGNVFAVLTWAVTGLRRRRVLGASLGGGSC
jgi:hypothetical protein